MTPELVPFALRRTSVAMLSAVILGCGTGTTQPESSGATSDRDLDSAAPDGTSTRGQATGGSDARSTASARPRGGEGGTERDLSATEPLARGGQKGSERVSLGGFTSSVGDTSGSNQGGGHALGGSSNAIARSSRGGSSGSGGTRTTGTTTAAGGKAAGATSGKTSLATGGATSATNRASGGTTNASSTPSQNGKVFGSCRFHFGTIDSIAKNAGSSLISQLDFFTPGWMGTNGDTFDQGYVCEETKSGAALAGLVPVVVSYIAAGYVKRHHNLCDCNVSGCSAGDLCKYGAQYLQADLTSILAEYKSFATGYAACYGTSKPIIFEMEPDWYQYTISNQTQPLSPTQAGSMMGQFVATMKAVLPNAVFSLDVSPWVGNNGADHGAAWFANFDMSLFTFVNTSGGGTNANTAKIRNDNNMTWAGLSSAAKKPILADTGYGANGVSAGHDPNWDALTNLNARIADGVVSIAQYNPNTGAWANTIGNLRGQLSPPKYCP